MSDAVLHQLQLHKNRSSQIRASLSPDGRASGLSPSHRKSQIKMMNMSKTNSQAILTSVKGSSSVITPINSETTSKYIKRKRTIKGMK